MKCHFLLLGALLSSSVLFAQKPKLPVHQDVPFVQEYSIKYYFKDTAEPLKAYTDLNGAIKVSTKSGLYQLYAGQFLYPGTLEKDVSYRPIADKKIANLGLYQHQFVMIDDKAVLSNAWAGKLFKKHSLPDAYLLAGGKEFSFLISNGTDVVYLSKEGTSWKENNAIGKML